MMISQNELTKIFLKQWNKSIDDVNVKLYSKKWWVSNRTQHNSFRLSSEGLLFLTDILKLASYEIPFNSNIEINSQFLVHLEKYMDCPYYLTQRSIIVFSEKRGIELSFIDDIQKFGMKRALKNKLTP